jgi:hypothetical protein
MRHKGLILLLVAVVGLAMVAGCNCGLLKKGERQRVEVVTQPVVEYRQPPMREHQPVQIKVEIEQRPQVVVVQQQTPVQPPPQVVVVRSQQPASPPQPSRVVYVERQQLSLPPQAVYAPQEQYWRPTVYYNSPARVCAESPVMIQRSWCPPPAPVVVVRPYMYRPLPCPTPYPQLFRGRQGRW